MQPTPQHATVVTLAVNEMHCRPVAALLKHFGLVVLKPANRYPANAKNFVAAIPSTCTSRI